MGIISKDNVKNDLTYIYIIIFILLFNNKVIRAKSKIENK